MARSSKGSTIHVGFSTSASCSVFIQGSHASNVAPSNPHAVSFAFKPTSNPKILPFAFIPPAVQLPQLPEPLQHFLKKLLGDLCDGNSKNTPGGCPAVSQASCSGQGSGPQSVPTIASATASRPLSRFSSLQSSQTNKNQLQTLRAADNLEADSFCVEVSAGQRRVYKVRPGTEKGQQHEGFYMVDDQQTGRGHLERLVKNYLLPQVRRWVGDHNYCAGA